jgi:hypothetical protein
MFIRRVKQIIVESKDFTEDDKVCPHCSRVGTDMVGGSIKCLNCGTKWNVILEEVNK